jgi:glycosyltransferase involved in cell wall biosynthesis
MPNFCPLITVITPSWNRSHLLDRLFEGLKEQTYTNFEWIVCDDGSTDDTAQKIQLFIETASFSMTSIIASEHVGKVRMDNEAVARAKGDYVIWCDSDDYLLPNAITDMVNILRSIPACDRDNYVGVTALCADENGEVVSSDLPFDHEFDTTWNELVTTYGVKGDMIYMTRLDALKKNPFPEVDLVVPESVVWNVIGEEKARVRPVLVQIKIYNASNAISFIKEMAYSRGRAYSLATTFRCLKPYQSSILHKYWMVITFIRYSIHGEITFGDARSLWGANSSKLSFYFLSFFAYCLSVKDRFSGKVRMTHPEFEAAKNRVNIKVLSNRLSNL